MSCCIFIYLVSLTAVELTVRFCSVFYGVLYLSKIQPDKTTLWFCLAVFLVCLK